MVILIKNTILSFANLRRKWKYLELGYARKSNPFRGRF